MTVELMLAQYGPYIFAAVIGAVVYIMLRKQGKSPQEAIEGALAQARNPDLGGLVTELLKHQQGGLIDSGTVHQILAGAMDRLGRSGSSPRPMVDNSASMLKEAAPARESDSVRRLSEIVHRLLDERSQIVDALASRDKNESPKSDPTEAKTV